MNQRFLRLPLVLERTGISRSQLYVMAKLGVFPAPYKLSERSSAWLESEIDEWIEERIEHRNETRQGRGGAS